MDQIAPQIQSSPWQLDLFRLRECFETNSYLKKSELSDEKLQSISIF